MAGFQLKLKKDGIPSSGVKRTTTGFSLAIKKKGSNVAISSSNALKGNESDDDDDEDENSAKRVKIDSFAQRKGGALAGKVAISVKKEAAPLIIVPKNLNRVIGGVGTTTSIFIPNNQEQDAKSIEEIEVQEEQNKLQYGITKFSRTVSKVVPIAQEAEVVSEEARIRNSVLQNEDPARHAGLVLPVQSVVEEESDEEQDYDKVPVEQFGAALLRGMGWKPTKTTKTTTDKVSKIVENRQKGTLLGIGAKKIETELIQDLNGKKHQAPLLRRDKKTGEIMKE